MLLLHNVWELKCWYEMYQMDKTRKEMGITWYEEETCSWRRLGCDWDLYFYRPIGTKLSTLSYKLLVCLSHRILLLLHRTILVCWVGNTKSHNNCLKFGIINLFGELFYLQNFHRESVHPPNICVEDEIVNILPVVAMLVDRFRHDDSVQDAMHIWIIRVWLY